MAIVIKQPTNFDGLNPYTFQWDLGNTPYESLTLYFSNYTDEVRDSTVSVSATSTSYTTPVDWKRSDGKTYSLKIQGYTSWAGIEESNEVFFKCYDTPDLTVDPIQTPVPSSSLTAKFTYFSKDSIPLMRYEYSIDTDPVFAGGAETRFPLSLYGEEFTVKGLNIDYDYTLTLTAYPYNYTPVTVTYTGITAWYEGYTINPSFDIIQNCDKGTVEIHLYDSGSTVVDWFKIKRRLYGTTGEWVTFALINGSDFAAKVVEDFLCASGVEYEYAIVGLRLTESGNIEDALESGYVTRRFTPKFNKFYVGEWNAYGDGAPCLTDTHSFGLKYDLEYSSNARAQQTGVFTPLGNKNPIIVANGMSSYEKGSVGATILNDSFDLDGKINPNEIVAKKNEIKDFLTNRKAKVIKDWNGNIHLVGIVGDINVSYLQGSSLSIPHIQFEWIQIGDVFNIKDLNDNGFYTVS